MLGTMMDVPMLLSRLVEHAGDFHGATEVVSRCFDGGVERSDWARLRLRARRLGKALTTGGHHVDGVIGSLAWNSLNHVELIYGALGIGVGLHTLNPRLAADDLRYMAEKVGSSVIFIDHGTLALAEALAPLVPHVRQWIYMDEPGEAVPDAALPGFVTKSAYVAGVDADFAWPSFDERQAATICFTSGTTGRPKGVVYSHRALTLSAMNMTMADMYGGYQGGALECVMPIAAIFHANGWMMPFSAPMNGHKLVLIGRAFDAPSAVAMIRDEGVTVGAGVPTIWQDILAHAAAQDMSMPTLRTVLMAGSRPSAALAAQFEAMGIAMRQSWGMTEAPGAARATPSPGLDPADQALWVRERQGRAGFQTQFRIVDDAGIPLPPGSDQPGHFEVRGPSVAGRYLGEPESEAVDWLKTGDIVRLDARGALELVDRSKDVIKSGGEWISTLQLENAAMGFPGIRHAAAIGIPHPRWQERPLLLCTLAEGVESLDVEALLAHMGRTLAKWWLPEEVRVIADMPTTSTGKIDKVALRREHGRGFSV